MKRLLILMVVVGIAVSASAQSPVQVTVQRITKKNSEQGQVKRVGRARVFQKNTESESLTLRVTLQNITSSSIENVVVRWGVVKNDISGTSHSSGVAYGREERCSLKPRETKVIETESVKAERKESQRFADRIFGEKIYGHGVQVLIRGGLVWKEYLPAAVEKTFENLKPLSEQDKESNREETPKKKK